MAEPTGRRGSDGTITPSPLLSGGQPLGPRLADVVIWALAALALIATLWLSFGTPTRVYRFVGSDKVGHGIAYAVDTLLLLFAVVWRPSGSPPLVSKTVPVLISVLALGGVVEVIQGAVGRDAQVLDWLADGVGVAVAAAIFTILRARYEASSSGG